MIVEGTAACRPGLPAERADVERGRTAYRAMAAAG